MTEHIKVEESFVEAIIDGAGWKQLHLDVLTEGKKKGDKSEDKPEDKADFETGARKGDKSDEKPGDKPDFTTDARKGDKSKTKPGKKDFESDDDEMKESVEVHECPLCESVLEEELTDEQIYEHVAQITKALNTLEEGGDDDGDVEPTPEDLDAIENESTKTKKESVMKKVKELKKAATGK